VSERAGAAAAELDALRTDIEQVDVSLIELLSKRVELARRAGEVKRAAALPILDPPREAAQIRRAAAEPDDVPEHVAHGFRRYAGFAAELRRAQLGEPL
jgi:chorismate mutase